VRIVYLGTSGFAASVLERLAETPHRPVLVVTRPDRPAGRGRRLTPPPVAEVARRLGIDIDQPEDVNGPEARARIAAAEPDVVVVCAFGALLKEPLLSEFELLNIHPSLLPRWRGAAGSSVRSAPVILSAYVEAASSCSTHGGRSSSARTSRSAPSVSRRAASVP